MACLKKWCMENLSLKCEICGSVYKDDVVAALMETFVDAQARNIALHGFDALITVPSRPGEEREGPVIGVALSRGGSPRAGRNAANHHVHELQQFLDDLVQMHVRSLASVYCQWIVGLSMLLSRFPAGLKSSERGL
jgi:hypothetical protein